MIITDLAQMAEEDCGLCMFPDLQDNFKPFECSQVALNSDFWWNWAAIAFNI